MCGRKLWCPQDLQALGPCASFTQKRQLRNLLRFHEFSLDPAEKSGLVTYFPPHLLQFLMASAHMQPAWCQVKAIQFGLRTMLLSLHLAGIADLAKL